MGAIYGFLRGLNALVCRLAGLGGLFVGGAVFNRWRDDPAALERAFGGETQAMAALWVLPALSLVLLLPPVARAVFHGGVEWRMLRGVLQIAVLAVVLILASLALPAVMPPQAFVANEATLILVAKVVLGAMALSWLGRETGVRPGAAPPEWDQGVSRGYLRQMRKARMPRG